ncbi:hypothetical protein A3Q56_02691 [Intoshia linei]|uniref:MEIOB-like N-terminal domain-containing protein n=1 Tax=Intoshia linei TaxID=1819745 RepID=A0A177B7G1_9BILA|nr:hypothetical protein A3Q56_02691 [Intoshia linei]
MTLFSKNIVNLSNSDRTGVYHSLYSISPKDSSVSVTGIVIKVQDPRCTSKDRTNRSYTSILTIRDSVQDFVNVTLYGSLKYFKMAFELICVGNTVQFSNLSVNEKNRDKENYKPWTPVNYYLFGSEEKCTFRKTQSFGESWQLLINYLTKPLIHYKNLGLVDTKQNQIISMIGILTRVYNIIVITID